VHKDARLVEVILSESDEVVRRRRDVLIVAHRLGFVMANAGVDQSNIDSENGEHVLLLPRDPDASASALKTQLDREFGVNMGIVINDSFGRAWRNGVVGVALGAAGVPALWDMVGMPDLFGRQMRVTEVGLADEIAAAASLLMGQAAEGQPVVHLRGLVCDAPAVPASALLRAKALDLFR
jgi:coenzyme F420-0:L-glutamate ligase/coenzyme F420-1:gamma-L-glutamate ligase